MPKNKKEVIVIDLGGSIVSPQPAEINLKFLQNFKNILKQQSDIFKFIIVVGGGQICRKYLDFAKKAKINDHNILDWVGIRATQLNASFLIGLLGDMAQPQLLINSDKKIVWKEEILVSGGWHPGNSTDFIAMKLAIKYKAIRVIVASNMDYIYDKDFRKFKDAKKFENLTWKQYKNLITDEWKPGMSVPLDPSAAKLGLEKKIKTFLLNGTNLKNLEKAIQGKAFKGTIIN